MTWIGKIYTDFRFLYR